MISMNKLEKNRSELISLIGQVSLDDLKPAIMLLYETLSNNRKILIAGNGGSAADAQHIAGEFVGRFMIERRPLPALALSTDTSVMTCISNDYSYEDVFARQIEALGACEDVLWVLSTSGNSANIINAMRAARKLNMQVLSFLGHDGGKALELSDTAYLVKSVSTARIQEMHLFAYHTIIEHVEDMLFGLG